MPWSITMSDFNFNVPITRRRVLALGGATAGGLLLAGSPLGGGVAVASPNGRRAIQSAASGGTLPVEQIEAIMQAEGTVMDTVLSIEIEREDLFVTGPEGIPFKPAWEIKHEFHFQPIGDNQALLNGDMALLAEELNPVIDQILANGLVFQAEHQHFFDLSPQVWFIHFRGINAPLQLAKAAAALVSVTTTPLPQHLPDNPTTPLNANALATILGGTAEIGSEGVVTVSIPRADTIVLAGVPLKPEAGAQVTVAFEPLEGGGSQYAAVAPDPGMTASEVNPTIGVLRKEGFAVHCLYNQETDEQPQLYFSHALAVGNAEDLARKVRKAINHMNLDF